MEEKAVLLQQIPILIKECIRWGTETYRDIGNMDDKQKIKK
jgi:hypothetical protein